MENKIRGFSSNRGQLTLFIIIALLIISVILIYFYAVKPGTIMPSSTRNTFEGCMYDVVDESIEQLGKQGGFANPEFYYMYQGEKVGYVCYTDEYYKPCVVQKPFLKQHFERELVKSARDKIYSCYDNYLSELEAKGYSVTGEERELNISILPEKILIELNAPVTMTRGGSSRYTKFISLVNSNLYEILMISNSILQYETNYGDSETTDFMDFYQDIVIDKLKQSEGTTIYILKDSKTKFQFASRSYALPAGYGVSVPLKAITGSTVRNVE